MLKRALKDCPASGPLWVQLSRAMPTASQRRAVLEQARHRLPASNNNSALEDVWRESLRLERENNGVGFAQLLQRCPFAHVRADFSSSS